MSYGPHPRDLANILVWPCSLCLIRFATIGELVHHVKHVHPGFCADYRRNRIQWNVRCDTCCEFLPSMPTLFGHWNSFFKKIIVIKFPFFFLFQLCCWVTANPRFGMSWFTWRSVTCRPFKSTGPSTSPSWKPCFLLSLLSTNQLTSS